MSDLTETVGDALANATPGPWTHGGRATVTAPRGEGMRPRLVAMAPAYSPEDSANMHLIANAPELCDRLVMIEAAIERVRALHSGHHRCTDGNIWALEWMTDRLYRGHLLGKCPTLRALDGEQPAQ